jgi:hypothetical protein
MSASITAERPCIINITKDYGMKLDRNRYLGEAFNQIMQRFIAIMVLMFSFPLTGLASGQRDLDDGIAFYENLDTDRALERLTLAANASDLDAKSRAKAWMFVGVIHFELGEKPKASKAWKTCFGLDAASQAPDGISPKMLEAITIARVEAKSSPSPAITTDPKDAGPKDGGVTKAKTPTKEPADKLPVVTSKPPDPDEPSGALNIFGPNFDWVLWGSVGGGVAAAVIVTVIVIALNTGSNECPEESGGCIIVTYK